MMWEMVAQMVARGFIVSNLYVTIEPATVEAGEGSKHIVLDGRVDEHINSIPERSSQGCVESTGDGYGSELWQTFAHANTIDQEEGPQQAHEGEHLADDKLHRGTSDNNHNDHGLGDDATHIDDTKLYATSSHE